MLVTMSRIEKEIQNPSTHSIATHLRRLRGNRDVDSLNFTFYENILTAISPQQQKVKNNFIHRRY